MVVSCCRATATCSCCGASFDVSGSSMDHPGPAAESAAAAAAAATNGRTAAAAATGDARTLSVPQASENRKRWNPVSATIKTRVISAIRCPGGRRQDGRSLDGRSSSSRRAGTSRHTPQAHVTILTSSSHGSRTRPALPCLHLCFGAGDRWVKIRGGWRFDLSCDLRLISG